MLGNVPGWLTVAGTFLTLTTLAATGFAVFGSQWSKTRGQLKDEIIKDHEIRKAQLEADKKLAEAERDAERTKRVALEGIVTGHAELVQLREELKAHDSRVHNKLDSIFELMQKDASV